MVAWYGIPLRAVGYICGWEGGGCWGTHYLKENLARPLSSKTGQWRNQAATQRKNQYIHLLPISLTC